MATPKLYLDEDVSPRVAEALRRQGFDVLHVREVGRMGEPDAAQLEFAAAHQRALFSYNRIEFEELAVQWFREGREHWGIVLSPRQYSIKRIKQLLGKLVEFLQENEAEALRNRLRYL
jgi:predicted nuclease of predicted toxin-antitoxin system